ncbi:MAG: type II secretion system protein [Gammaproteobacteria bacterium]|nr:type II secretion system protein [Gammaproteobacteria bacterium]MDP2349466.1 type II secretion system protein [Gammaproteobacteria bacterium]
MKSNFLNAGKGSGFTLIEMAVVLLIVGLMLSGLFASLGSSTENKRRTDATAQLNRIEEALYGFAQTNGRLPCPAVPGVPTGQEDPLAGGVCTNSRGFVPAVTLGIQGAINTDGLLLDPWGNPYRYVVSERVQVLDRAFTTSNGLRALFANGSLTIDPATRLCVSSAVNCTGTTFTNSAPALVFSMGSDWQTFSSAIQVENASAPPHASYPNIINNDFVNAPYAEDGTQAFDDILVWLSPQILFSRLISAGRLP